jgi:hypothetical protein
MRFSLCRGLKVSGGACAVKSGHDLRDAVAGLARTVGLDARVEVTVGRRIWGAERRIDVVVTHVESRRRLGIECKYQGSTGTAEEKIALTIQDIGAWPIPGIVVFSGEGFSPHMIGFLIASGKAVEFEDLESWLRMFFALDLA